MREREREKREKREREREIREGFEDSNDTSVYKTRWLLKFIETPGIQHA